MSDRARTSRRWLIALAIAAFAASATAAAPASDRVRSFHAARDAEIAQRWKSDDLDAVVAAVDDIFLRLPDDPLGRLWLAAALAALGMPETGERLGRDLLDEYAGTAAADAFTAAAGQLRGSTIVVRLDDDTPLSPPARATLATGVARWAKDWAETPEAPPSPTPRPALARALALADALAGGRPAGRARVDVVAESGGATITLRRSAARAITDLDVALTPELEPLHVDGAALSKATAPLVARLRNMRAVVEERLAGRLDAGDAAGLLAALEKHAGQLGDANAERAWLAAVFTLLRMPEHAQALLRSLPTTTPAKGAAWTTTATAVRARLADAIVTTELTFEPEPGIDLLPADRATLERGVGRWLESWTAQPETVEPPASAPVEARARARLPRGFVARPDVQTGWQDGRFFVRVASGRGRRPPALDLPAAPPLARVFAAAGGVLGRTSRIAVGPQFVVAFTSLEPDERVAIGGEVLKVDAEGKTTPVALPRHVVVDRRLGGLERHDEVTLDARSTTSSLPPWDHLERAERALGDPAKLTMLDDEQLAVVGALCGVDPGARGRRLLQAVLDRPRATIAVRGIDAGTAVDVGGKPTRVFTCHGEALLALPPEGDSVVVAVAPGRTLTIDAAARANAPLDFSSSVLLATKESGTRWRVVGTQDWVATSSPVPIPLDRDHVDVELAIPRHAPSRMTLRAALGEHRTEAVTASASAVRRDWQEWETAQAQRQEGLWLIAVPPALGVVAGGSAVFGWLFRNGAANAAAVYNTTTNLGVAAEQKAIVEQKGFLANAFAGVGIGVGALAVVTIAVPAAWFFVLHPATPAPDDFENDSDDVARAGSASSVADAKERGAP